MVLEVCFDLKKMCPTWVEMQSFFFLEVIFFGVFSGKFREMEAKILRTPKNLPAPTPMRLSVRVCLWYYLLGRDFIIRLFNASVFGVPKFTKLSGTIFKYKQNWTIAYTVYLRFPILALSSGMWHCHDWKLQQLIKVLSWCYTASLWFIMLSSDRYGWSKAGVGNFARGPLWEGRVDGRPFLLVEVEASLGL